MKRGTSGTALAATLVAPRQFEVREYALPTLGQRDGLLRVEACGVCGADVKKRDVVTGSGNILGHEVVGVIAELGDEAARNWRLAVGDRVVVEEYLPCGYCVYCRTGDYRFCDDTNKDVPGSAHEPTGGSSKLWYGSVSVDVAPSLWGGYSQYMYLHPNSVLHRIPVGVPAPMAALALPMSNGIEWTIRYGEAQMGDVVVVQGVGQQGLCSIVAAREGGARQIIASGLTRDSHRLALARRLGATHVINVEEEDFREQVMDVTGGCGVNVVVNVTGGGSRAVADALAVASRKRCTVVLAAAGSERIQVDGWGRKKMVLKWANGHSFSSVEQALRLIAEGRYPLEEMSSHVFDLDGVGDAIRTVARELPSESVHVSVVP